MARPLARFKDSNGQYYQAEWQPYVLSSLVNRVTRKNSENQTNIPLTMSARDGLIDQESYFNKTVASSDLSNYTLLYQGEFAYNHSSSKGYDYGAIHRLTKVSCGAVTPLYFCFSIKDRANIDSDFLAYYFESQKWTREVASICSKGARQHGSLNISVDDFFNIVIYIPSIEEQQQVVRIASSIDNTINQMESIVDAWEQRKKGVVQKLFSQEVRFKADDGSDFPDWKCKTLGELGTFQKGAPLSKAAISDNGTPLILYGELYTTYEEVAYNIVRRTEKKVEPKFLSHIGDVLIPTSGETAEDISTATCVMQEGVILGSDLLIYRPVPWLDGRILSYVINHQVKQAISRVAQGPQVVHIKEKDISKIKAYVPSSLEEQRKIAECLDAIDDVIALSKAELEKWRELKKGLLQQLFV